MFNSNNKIQIKKWKIPQSCDFSYHTKLNTNRTQLFTINNVSLVVVDENVKNETQY